MANHDSQLGGWLSMDMRSIAKMFCGEEMGLVMPPMLEARATPAVGGGGAKELMNNGTVLNRTELNWVLQWFSVELVSEMNLKDQLM
jgi:hypothetical protein